MISLDRDELQQKVYFVIPSAWAALFGLVDALEDAAPWVDITTAQDPLIDDHTLTATQWSQLLVTTLIWIVLPLVLGVIRLLSAELKSA